MPPHRSTIAPDSEDEARMWIPFKMVLRQGVQVRHDTKRALYIISNGEDVRDAIAVRMRAP